MTKENVRKLHTLIVERGTYIHNLLPKHHAHPGGRIGIAHIYSVIKAVMGVPMKECRDCRVDDIVEIINYCVDNVDMLEGLTAPLKAKFVKEPIEIPRTLEAFL